MGDARPGRDERERDPDGRAVPLASTGPSTPWRATSACPAAEVDALTAGVNHLAWVLRLEHRGRDLYPDLGASSREGGAPDDDLVRAELYRRFGFYPTESSEHHAEYNPWFIPKDDLVERFHVPIGEYLSRVANNLDEYAETKRRLDAGEPFEIERSGEYAAVIVNAMATGDPARIVANVMNGGRPGLIPNLAATPASRSRALVDGTGVHPGASGPCRRSAPRTPVRRSTARS